MSSRMLVGLLAVVLVACLCTTGWYTVKLVVTVLSAVGSPSGDHCECIQDDMAILRNASLAREFSLAYIIAH
ncbi:hypothetical protein MRX96_044654 [Rhipicephalus microplus]